MKDRSKLLIKPRERSYSDREYIYDLIRKLRAFTKCSEDLREKLAAVCVYQYLPVDRVIVRQGRRADNLYFIANGEVSLSKIAVDELTGERSSGTNFRTFLESTVRFKKLKFKIPNCKKIIT